MVFHIAHECLVVTKRNCPYSPLPEMKEEAINNATLGKYQILGTLGRGSMGVVYKAQDPGIGRIVAIKTLRKIGPSKFQNAESALERFRTEARSAGRLRHPNIITIFDASINDDTPFIVMDYVEGSSLESILNAEGKLPPQRAVPMLRQIAEALDEAHSHGVIHRDIKPSNIVVDGQGRPYILDFGVAKLNETIQEEMEEKPKEPVMGTPAYMSPEQILNRQLSSKSDIFSFALLCFEVLTGSRPFPGDTFNEVVNSILHNAPIPITSLVPDFPLQLEVEFEHMLAKKPEDRPESAQEVARLIEKSLQSAVGAGAVKTAGSATTSRSRKPSEWRSIGVSTPKGAAEGDVGEQEAAASGSSERPKPRKSDGQLVPLHQNHVPAASLGRPNTEQWSAPGAAPGDVFAQGDVGIRQQVRFRKQFSPFRAGVLVLGIAAVVASIFIVYSVIAGIDLQSSLGLKDPPKSEQPPTPVVDRSRILDDDNRIISFNRVPSHVGKEIESSALSELTDEQVLGVLVSPDTTETRKLEALTEVRVRKLGELHRREIGENLLNHESYVVRIETVKTLGELGIREAAPLLLDHLGDYDPLVREEIARALAKLGSLRSVAYLRQFYNTEQNPKVKKAIKAAIESITGLPMKSAF
ncbi:MAG: protein kinase [Bdellovibrionales bacterium]|nr:protein kinase [Bdellovibrionales bacterium]